ncbi:unnamed protein product, partial [Ectocarpus sp. 12 AP-2014]
YYGAKVLVPRATDSRASWLAGARLGAMRLSRCRLLYLCCGIAVTVGLFAALLRPSTETEYASAAAKLSPSSRIPAGVHVELDAFGAADPAASAAAVAAIDSASPKLLQELYRLARDDVLWILGDDDEARACVNWRKKPNQGCTDPSQCGKGWLFRRKGLLLGVMFTGGGDDSEDPSVAKTAVQKSSGTAGSGGPTDWIHVAEVGDRREGLAPDEWSAGTPGMMTVVGLREGADGELSDCNSRDLSMLLRLQGPEALAEAATPVAGRCAWTVRFQPTLEGVYTLDATLLDWRGGLEAHQSLCNEVAGQYGEGSVEMDAVRDGPFYGNFEGCCTLCTRREGCVAWSATNDPSKALVNGSRCVLYSSVTRQPVEDKQLKRAVRSGTPRAEESMTYLGPSMSIARRWCTEDNSNILGSGGRRFTVVAARETTIEENKREQGDRETEEEEAAVAASAGLEWDALPLCRSGGGVPTTPLPREGRWVSLRDTKCNLAPEMVDLWGWPTYDKDMFGSAAMPGACFLKPADRRKPTGELKHSQGGYTWQPYDCRYDLMDTDTRLSCFREKNITRFLDFGDSLISTSRMARTALWLPTADSSVWSTGGGENKIGEGAKESGCVGGPIQYYGEARHQDEHDGLGSPATTNRYCGVESYWQVKPGQVRNLVTSASGCSRFKPDVVLANWALVHRLWHHTLDEFQTFLKQLGRQLDGMTEQDGHRPRYMFWLSAPFLVSEREPHCVLERGLQFTKALRGLLEPRGWIEINWVSMTRKWGVDILDGMHHGEPATRMLAYLLMHHVCHASDSDR